MRPTVMMGSRLRASLQGSLAVVAPEAPDKTCWLMGARTKRTDKVERSSNKVNILPETED